ncbi:MAG: universal stress protein [Sneathiella sp.]|nr:universal stress protein [Sneathiella sp.]
MSSNAVRAIDTPNPNRLRNAGTNNHSPRVIVCVDQSELSAKVIPHARTIAKSLDGILILVHVMEPEKLSHAPSDPVEWDLRRREAQIFISGLASRLKSNGIPLSTKILEGQAAEQISKCMPTEPGDITALCRSEAENQPRIGETARRVMETSGSSILLVPACVPFIKKATYSKILVPLDGSPRAESAVPYAVRIALAENAELVLAHATPQPELMHFGPLSVEDIELRERVSRRNEMVAREYLDRIRAQLTDCSIPVRTLILKGGDVRHQLVAAVAKQSADLLVLSAQGSSGFADVSSGDVAGFLMARSPVPILMIRRPHEVGSEHIFSGTASKGARRPSSSIK